MSGASITTRGYVAGAGVADAIDPVIVVVSPDVLTEPGDPGGFSDDYDAAKLEPIIIDVTDLLPGVAVVTIVAAFLDGTTELVFFADEFWGEYAASEQDAIANGFEFTIRRSAGWPGSGTAGDVTLTVDAVDGAGNRVTTELAWILPAPSTPEPIEAPLVVAGIDAIDHVTDALSRLPHYLARLP